MRGKRKRALAFLLALVLGVSTTDVSALAAESNMQMLQEEAGTVSSGDSVSAGDSVSVGDSSGSCEEIVTEVVFENEDSKITFSLVGAWDGGYVTYVYIENIGDSAIEN